MYRVIFAFRAAIVTSTGAPVPGPTPAPDVWANDLARDDPSFDRPAGSRVVDAMSGRRFSSRWRQLPPPAPLFDDWDEV